MEEKNSLLFGFVLGCVVPVAGFIAVEFVFDTMTNAGWMAEVSPAGAGRRLRTLALIGICCNLIPFTIAKNRYWDATMRGIVFPTLIYVAAWLWKFSGDLFV